MTISPKTRWSWALVVLICLLLQAGFPIVSDEAYFISWGKDWAAGYYDHPPLPGWISTLLQKLGEAVGLQTQGVLHRTFSLLLAVASLWLISQRISGMTLEPVGGALVVLTLVPGYLILFNLYLNDTLLAFTVLLFVLATEWAFRAKKYAVLAMICAGLSFTAVLLTKYNGAVIYLGILLGLITWPGGRRFLFGRMVIISLIALVPFGLHLWWNINHCSINLAFNFGFRISNATGWGPLWVLLSLLIMSGLLGFQALIAITRSDISTPGFFCRTFLASMMVMFVVSVLRRDFGVNWGAPLGFLALLTLAEHNWLAKLRPAHMAGFALSALIVLPLAGVFFTLKHDLLKPDDLVNPRRAQSARLLLDLDNGSLIEAIRPFANDRVFAAMDYGIRAIFDNAGFEDTTVFSKSVFGRNQDLRTDFQKLDGAALVVLPNHPGMAAELGRTLFESFEVVIVSAKKGSYEVLLGQGFRYDAYLENWILPVMAKLYDKSPIPWQVCFMDQYRK